MYVIMHSVAASAIQACICYFLITVREWPHNSPVSARLAFNTLYTCIHVITLSLPDKQAASAQQNLTDLYLCVHYWSLHAHIILQTMQHWFYAVFPQSAVIDCRQNYHINLT